MASELVVCLLNLLELDCVVGEKKIIVINAQLILR